jgi:hypothetical protein
MRDKPNHAKEGGAPQYACRPSDEKIHIRPVLPTGPAIAVAKVGSQPRQ